MVDKGWGQNGVGWGVGNAANHGLTLSTGEDVSLGVGDFGSVNLWGVDGAHDGGARGHGEGVGGDPVTIMISPVMSGEGNSLGGNVGKGARHTPSSVPHGSVGLSSLAVSPSSLSELILGVVLGLGYCWGNNWSSSHDLMGGS